MTPSFRLNESPPHININNPRYSTVGLWVYLTLAGVCHNLHVLSGLGIAVEKVKVHQRPLSLGLYTPVAYM